MAKVLLLGLEEVMTDQLARVLLEQDHEVSAEALPGRVPGYLEADVVFASQEALFALKTESRTTSDAAAFTAVIRRPRPAKPVAVMNSKSRLPPVSKKIPCLPPTPVRKRFRNTTASEPPART